MSEGTEQVYRVEYIEPIDGKVIAIGSLTKSDMLELGLMLCPDDVIRISDFMWDANRDLLLEKFNLRLV